MSEDKKKIKPITPANFSIAESKRQCFVAVIPHGTRLEDIKSPSYFANVIKQIETFSRIEVHAEDGTFWAELLVTYCVSGDLKYEILSKFEVNTPEISGIKIEGLTVGYGGPHHKFRVVRDSDKEVIKKGFENKTSAMIWAQQHVRNLAA